MSKPLPAIRPSAIRALLCTAVSLIFLAACASKEEIRAQNRSTCAELGFEENTDAMANCLLQLEIARTHPYRFGRSRWL